MIREVLATLRELWGRSLGRRMLLSIVAIFVASTLFFSWVEGWSLLDSLYFTVVTLTTVGYGDLAPSSPLSRGFTIILILTGVGYILAFLNYLVGRTVERRRSDPDDGPPG